MSALPPADSPLSPEDILDRLRLARSRRVGPATFLRLMAEHGSARRALRALPSLASRAGVRDYAPCPPEEAEAEMAAGEAAGARLLALGAPSYPAALATIPDPPPVIWVLGEPALAARPCVALVGARNASALGCRLAARLARDLGAAGFVVVSGLARGIDAAAHRAALETGTIGVLAGGVDVIYPAENTELGEAIGARGLRLSELPPGHPPRTRDFPRRNRIIAGLSLGTVVVEGAPRSGSLITARMALEQGREVMAVPGNPLDARAQGCNALIRDGATLVRDAADVIEALGSAHAGPPRRPRAERCAPSPPAPAQKTEAADLGGQLLSLIGPSPVTEDALIRALGVPASEVAAGLLDLELAGSVARHPGGAVSLAADAVDPGRPGRPP